MFKFSANVFMISFLFEFSSPILFTSPIKFVWSICSVLTRSILLLRLYNSSMIKFLMAITSASYDVALCSWCLWWTSSHHRTNTHHVRVLNSPNQINSKWISNPGQGWREMTLNPGQSWREMTLNPGKGWREMTLNPGQGWREMTLNPGQGWREMKIRD